jgi:cytochrome c nitrite reductase small subunit
MSESTIGKIWRAKGVKAIFFIVVGLVLAFPVFSISYYSMYRTSTPEFCSSCHEIQAAYNDWKTSSHASNTKGFVAVCMDCHLPPPHDTFNFFYAKTFHGLKDVVSHFLGGPYDRQAAREQAWATIKNENCLKCHQNLLYMPYKRGAMLAHRSVLYPRPGYEKSCFDCHKTLVHKPKQLYSYGS